MPPPPTAPAFTLSSLALTTPPQASLSVVPALVPPAWLPVDLLPESYQLPAAPKADPIPPESTSAASAPSQKSAAPRRTNRLLPLAALCAILAWAGHAAWQRGHLAPLVKSLRSLTHIKQCRRRITPLSIPSPAGHHQPTGNPSPAGIAASDSRSRCPNRHPAGPVSPARFPPDPFRPQSGQGC